MTEQGQKEHKVKDRYAMTNIYKYKRNQNKAPDPDLLPSDQQHCTTHNNAPDTDLLHVVQQHCPPAAWQEPHNQDALAVSQERSYRKVIAGTPCRSQRQSQAVVACNKIHHSEFVQSICMTNAR